MIVIKVGGGEGNQIDHVCRDIADLVAANQPLVLIHGGSHLTNELAEQLGHPPRFITSPSGFTSRYTDRRTMEIFQMAYCGLANKSIVEQLQTMGVNAIGLSGMDGRLWQGPRKKAIRAVEGDRKIVVRDNLTGVVEQVNRELIQTLLDLNFVPVITPPAISYEGEPINVDGDRAAAATAAALNAAKLVILSNVPGLMKDIDDPQSMIPSLQLAELDTAMEQYAAGRMRIKLLAAREALESGVEQVIIADSRRDHCLTTALQGEGTLIGS